MTRPATVPFTTLPLDRIGVRPPRFTAPEGVRFGRVTLSVANLAASLDFYTRVIGFTVHAREQDAARLGTPDGQVFLELREQLGARPVPPRGRLGLYHFAMLLPSRADLGRFLRHALALGVHVGQSDHHFSEATYLRDPDGLTIEVYRDRARDEWRATEGGEIIGGSDPLDLAALFGAASSEPWRGLPVGTTLGHLHFYVGDLTAAARFYHDGLGFPITTWSWPGALFLGAGGYHHHFGLNTWAAGSEPAGPSDARLLVWDLVLPDRAALDATVASLRAAGFDVTPEPDGPRARDPWGLGVRLLAP